MQNKNKAGTLNNKKKAKKIITLLRREYPFSKTALVHDSALQLLIATILSAQCTDKKVNQVTAPLFKKYSRAEDFARANPQEFEQEIRPTGFYRNKAKNIIATAEKICRGYAGEVPDSMEALLTLPGVARKTANIVLSSAFQKAEGIAVDTHVKRLANRLGLSSKADPNKIEKDLLEAFSRNDRLDVNYLLVDHGRKICNAAKPLCPQCVLRKICPSAIP